MFPFLAEPAVKYVGGLSLAILLFTGAYVKGRYDGHALAGVQVTQAKAEWQAHVAGLQLIHQKEISDIAGEYIQETWVLRDRVEWLKKHPKIITKYIPKAVDIEVPTGFVELHDKAVAGASLDVEEVVDAAKPSGTKLSKVGVLINENYNTCNVEKAQLAALQKIIINFQKKQQEVTQ